MPKRAKSPVVKIVNVVCSLALFVAIAFMVIAEFSIAAASVIGVAVVGLAAPAVAGGQGVLDTLLAFVEALIDGVMTLVENVCNAISALFSGW